MATYAELEGLKDDQAMLDKVEVACWIAADTVFNDPSPPANQTDRLAWAKAVYDNPRGEAMRMWPAMLAQNKDQTLAAIQGASDAAIQTAVEAAIDLFT